MVLFTKLPFLAVEEVRVAYRVRPAILKQCAGKQRPALGVVDLVGSRLVKKRQLRRVAHVVLLADFADREITASDQSHRTAVYEPRHGHESGESVVLLQVR